MKLVGLMPIRNEDWIIGLSIRVALEWCDELIVLDHASFDNSSQILKDLQKEYPERLIVIEESKTVWEEMKHRQRLLKTARERKATHIALIDADEILTGNLLSDIRNRIQYLRPYEILQLPIHGLRNSILTRHASGIWSNRIVTLAFKDSHLLHWTTKDGYDFHQRNPLGVEFISVQPIDQRFGGVMHLQFVNDQRLRAKQALYKMTEVIRWPHRNSVEYINRIYNPSVYDYSGMKPVPENWWLAYAPWLKYLFCDSKPWQEDCCLALLKQHGHAKFRGLDLFGVIPNETSG